MLPHIHLDTATEKEFPGKAAEGLIEFPLENKIQLLFGKLYLKLFKFYNTRSHL